MLPTFRQTNTSNMSSFLYLLLLLMDWDDRSCTYFYLIQIHFYKVSYRSVGNFHNLIFCIFLINQVGFSMFETTIMYSQLSRMYRTLKFWLRLMFRVKNVEIPELKFVMNIFICVVCVYLRSMTSIWVVVHIVVNGDGQCWYILCRLWWYGFIAHTHSIVM